MPAHRSVSQLTSYGACGEQFRLSRIARAPSRPAGWFMHGTAFHGVIEEWEKAGRPDVALDEQFSTLFRALIEAEQVKWPDEGAWMTGGRKSTAQDIEDREAIGRWQVEDYRRFALEHAAEWRIVATEVEFRMDFGGVEVLGYIDQIRQYADGRIEASDLKTGTSNAGSAIQLATYAHAVEKFMGVPRPMRGVFVKAGRPATARAKAKPTVDVDADLTHWTKARLDRWFYDMDRAERAGIYLANPQDGCERTCGVAQFCFARGHESSAAQYAPAPLKIQEAA